MTNKTITAEDITLLTDEQLQDKIQNIRDHICKDFNLSSSILDIKLRELQLLKEESDKRIKHKKEVDNGL